MKIYKGDVIPTHLSERLVYGAVDPKKNEALRFLTKVGLLALGAFAFLCTLGIATPFIIKCYKSYSAMHMKVMTIAQKAGVVSTTAAIRVVCQEERGWGDEMFALRVYHTLKKQMPPDVEVSLIPKGPKEQEKLHILDPNVPLMPLDGLDKEGEDRPRLLINGPVISTKPSFPSSEQTKVWDIAEYSVRWGKQDRAGPGEGELGIFCEEDLYQLGKELYESGRSSDPEALQQLHNPHLKELLLFNKDKRYYFGYSHEEENVFQFTADLLDSITQSSQDSDVCLVWPEGAWPGLNNREDRIEEFIRHIREKFQGLDCDLEIWRQEEGQQSFKKMEFEHLGSSPKKVRIFLIGKADHDDFIRLLKASQPYALITGDQSLSEALSLGKVILYETFGHKKALKANLIALADRLGLQKWKIFLDRQPKKYISPTPLPKEVIEDPDLVKEARKMSDFIYQERNLEKTIVKRVREWLSHLGEP